MKTTTLLATLAITIASCNCQKTSTNAADTVRNTITNTKTQNIVPTIYYDATTRGFQMSIKVENQILYHTKDRDFKEYSDKIKISDADWNEISELAKAIDLEKVKDLKWPTEKRYYDGAPFANIIFEANNIKYPANGFDHGYPPAEIEKLVNKILSLVPKK